MVWCKGEVGCMHGMRQGWGGMPAWCGVRVGWGKGGWGKGVVECLHEVG